MSLCLADPKSIQAYGNEAYTSQHLHLALDAIRDLRQGATEIVDSQRARFAARPPAKEQENGPLT
jgi:hypothetical protein